MKKNKKQKQKQKNRFGVKPLLFGAKVLVLCVIISEYVVTF